MESSASASNESSRAGEGSLTNPLILAALSKNTGFVEPDSARKELEKLEHRIDLALKNAAQSLTTVFTILYDIQKKGLFVFRDCKSMREYILKNNYPKRLSLHISSVFFKLQVIGYAEKYEVPVPVVQSIGEAKFKHLIQAKAELGKDISLEELQSIKVEALARKLLNKGKPSNAVNTAPAKAQAAQSTNDDAFFGEEQSSSDAIPETLDPIEEQTGTPAPLSLVLPDNDIKTIFVDDTRAGFYISLTKATYHRYLKVVATLDTDVKYNTRIELKG